MSSGGMPYRSTTASWSYIFVSVMPRLVERDQLKLANSVAYAQEKFWGLVGPVLAGVVITAISYMGGLDGTAIKALVGPAAAFMIDILAIVSSVLLLRRVRFASPEELASTEVALLPDKAEAEVPAPPAAQGSLRGLLLLLRQQVGLRMSFLMVYGINLITSGPLYIGMPMLAVSRFSEGAQALGFMNSALGFGALIGTLLAGILPQPKPQSVGKLIFGILGGLAAGGATLLLVMSLGVDAAAVSFLAGLISYVNVVGIVQIQRDTPPEFLGRMMGLINMK